MTIILGNMEMIGRGAQADIYAADGRAYKAFRMDYDKKAAQSEAELQQKAFRAGLPVPEVFGLIEADGRSVLVMEHVIGVTLGEKMLADIVNMEKYMQSAVSVQVSINSMSGNGFPPQRNKLYRKINALETKTDGEARAKNKLLRKLDRVIFDDRLCHGDFHVHNLICAQSGIKIIDWQDASSGNAGIDACRSYLLYLMYSREAAECYMNVYTEMTGVLKEDIIKYLPVLAAARISEMSDEKDKAFLINLIFENI